MSKMLAKSRMTRVLGVTSTGFPIYLICGAENGDNDGGDGSNSGTDSDKDKDANPEGDPSGDGAAIQPKMYSEEDYNTILRRLNAADEAKGKAEKRLQEMDDAERSELEKAQRDLQVAQQKLEHLEKENLRGKIANAILQYPGFTWHDPEVVLQLVDMDDLDVDQETGKVKGVKDALTKLSKDKPFLLKGKTQQDDKDKDSKNGTGAQNGASGHSPQSGQPDEKNKRREEMAKKYKLRR